jgi:hypothetical protein
MKGMKIALAALAVVCAGTITTAREAKPAVDKSSATGFVRDDNMTPYRNMATETLKAFQAHDLATARKRAKDLETMWDKNEKALQKSAPEVWKQIDDALDAFIKPLSDKAPDAAKVQATYDAFIAKLKLGVKGGVS